MPKKLIIILGIASSIAVAYFLGGTHAAKNAMREANLTTLNNLGLLERTLEKEGIEAARTKIKSQMKGTLDVFESYKTYPVSIGAIFILKPESLLWSDDAEAKVVAHTKETLKEK